MQQSIRKYLDLGFFPRQMQLYIFFRMKIDTISITNNMQDRLWDFFKSTNVQIMLYEALDIL